MADSDPVVPLDTLETIARSFYKAAAGYGFHQVDYLRFVNIILDMSMKGGEPLPAPSSASGTEDRPGSLPAQVADIAIRDYNEDTDRTLVENWIADASGRYFLLSRTTARPLEVNELVHDTDRNVLGVITLGDGSPIGLMAFLDYDKVQRKAELRKLIGDVRHRGKGYGKQATAVWIKHGINVLGLRKIYLNTVETDLRNIRLNEQLGFKVEGILRNECWFDGAYHDILRMALLVD